LNRLDRLTQEEAEMAAAQVLKATHAVDDAGRVRGVADIALNVDNRMAGVIDQLNGIDDMVAVVREGTQYTFNQSSKNDLTPDVHRWKRGQGSHATSSRWRRPDRTFVVSELHSCWICTLNYRHRESITTGSS
jgi:hypothetical protein